MDSADQPLSSQFLSASSCSDPKSNLEMSGNNLELAVSLFLDTITTSDGGGDETTPNASVEQCGSNAPALAGISDVQLQTEIGVANDVLVDLSSSSEPDYDYLVEENVALYEQYKNEIDCSFNDSVPSTPDYDNLGADCEEEEQQHQRNTNDLTAKLSTFPVIPSTNEFDKIGSKEHQGESHHGIDQEDFGDEYILGTLMVRVLQARNLRPNPNSQGGIGTLLSNHRRARHQRSTMSPASGGNMTPSSSLSLNPYAKVNFRGQTQLTSTAFEHAHGDHHWSRGDQSYFDVTCSSFPLRMGKIHQSRSFQSFKSKSSSQQSSPRKEPIPKKVASWSKMDAQPNKIRPSLPMLHFSLYSKSSSSKHKKQFGPDTSNNESDYFVGKCSINVLRVLTGKTPYFDEWCTLHNENINETGRVRIVIEYEPADPPPRPGDLCVFANVYPIDEELYPVPLYTVKNITRTMRTSMSMSSCTTLSSTSLSSLHSRCVPLALHPKSFRVDEVVGDHVVLSYKTSEGWNCTFEVHRYLLLCIERYQAVVEKCRDQVLDLCDNFIQSPMVDIIGKKIVALPDEGLVHVASEAVGGGVHMLGRWLSNGVEFAVEDVVDGFNLDGRYSHLSDDEEDVESSQSDSGYDAKSLPQKTDTDEEKKALPGMPCCPITGVPMIDPVVASDGHTYERNAISRWMQTSNKSPLTGEVLAHSQLVSNYMLIGLSSLPNSSEESCT